MKLIKILSIAALPLFMAACATKQEAPKTTNTDVIPVKTMALETASAGGTINTSGQFTTDDEAYLSFKTGGIINKILVKEGDAVQTGQLLATLNMAEINALADQARIGYEKATRDLKRVTNLYKDSVATLEQMQNAQTAVDLARQQLTAAEFNKSHSEIRATKSGYILHKMANEGQMAGPGTPVLQVNGAKSGNWFLRASVSDREWAAISINDKATIITDAGSFDGAVARRSEGADPMTGSFSIDIKFTGKQAGIAAGMFGKATIITGAAKSTAHNWAIPYDALLDGDGSSGYVFVTTDNKTAHKVKVTVASIEKDKVIISDGLQDAGSLIISGSAYLADNSNIRVINTSTAKL
jgi:RND family efflux transporter MFP subunit